MQTVKERQSELTKLKAKLPNRDAKDEVFEEALAEVLAVSQFSNLIAALGNKAMQEKHWIKVWKLVDAQPQTLLNFTFQQLLQAGID